MKICLLVPSVYGMRGDVRGIVNLATALAEQHEVEILSVKRTKEKPFFPIDPRIKIRWIADARPGVRRFLPGGHVRTEVSLWRRLRGLHADVLITTRPSLGVQAARHAPKEIVRIAREWGRPAAGAPVKRFYPRLDAVVTVGRAAQEEWTRLLGDDGPVVHRIVDPLPAGPWPRSRLDNRIIAAGGRLVPAKAYDRLLRAFAVVADKRPDWRLRLYGAGSEEKRLRALVTELGLHNHVYFMGTTPDLAGEFAKASLVAVTSRAETIGMTVVEALGCGVPVVGFEGARGPREFIEHGVNGLLVPEGDDEIEAFAGALLGLMDDEQRRRTLAAGARRYADTHEPGAVVEQWVGLIDALRSDR
ncbi:glycosyltransferase [Thermostaphylospora chromogena]|uniref:Glycosyltransferase involved in cell wall bisynthesis n=1 Tax=Thermostaphylospora chromogena TaxID=35622 RepID=A0A1H1C3Q0_9ACTN|nr:glycosyltransferase [Thermostaphylospora chromogena]SDQ58838.1 Glycosyltransferase involved in cell wall bisynthesis [Thermostaphylospora chromogena]